MVAKVLTNLKYIDKREEEILDGGDYTKNSIKKTYT